jgi:hypothetical protein
MEFFIFLYTTQNAFFIFRNDIIPRRLNQSLIILRILTISLLFVQFHLVEIEINRRRFLYGCFLFLSFTIFFWFSHLLIFVLILTIKVLVIWLLNLVLHLAWILLMTFIKGRHFVCLNLSLKIFFLIFWETRLHYIVDIKDLLSIAFVHFVQVLNCHFTSLFNYRSEVSKVNLILFRRRFHYGWFFFLSFVIFFWFSHLLIFVFFRFSFTGEYELNIVLKLKTIIFVFFY